KGLHVHVPLRASDGFDAVRGFARQASEVLAARNPDLVTTQQRRAGRGDLVYSDVMRNAYAQTVVAPYSVRARPGANVATPLRWEELADQGLTPRRFTLRSLGSRLGLLGAPRPCAGVGPPPPGPGPRGPARGGHRRARTVRPRRPLSRRPPATRRRPGRRPPARGPRPRSPWHRSRPRAAARPAWPSRAWRARRAW